MRSIRNPPGTGPFSRESAFALGYTISDIRAAIRRGEWIVLRRGIFVTAEDRQDAAGDPSTLHAQDIQALLLALRRTHIGAAGTSAARILGMEFLNPPPSSLIVCTDDPGVSGTHKRDYFLRAAPLPAGHLVTRHGVPVTSAARTLLDLASAMSFSEAVVMADSALHQQLLRPADIRTILASAVNRPGIERAREALLFADGASESVLESLSRASMHLSAVILAPKLQQWIVVRGRRFRVDYLWDHLGIDVYGEADGLQKYGIADGDQMSIARAIRAEKERHQLLLDTGAEVVRWGMHEARNPALLAARINGAFTRATERQLGRSS